MGCGGEAPTASVCVAIDPGCCGAVEARELTQAPGGWTPEILAGTELGLETVCSRGHQPWDKPQTKCQLRDLHQRRRKAVGGRYMCHNHPHNECDKPYPYSG